MKYKVGDLVVNNYRGASHVPIGAMGYVCAIENADHPTFYQVIFEPFSTFPYSRTNSDMFKVNKFFKRIYEIKR